MQVFLSCKQYNMLHQYVHQECTLKMSMDKMTTRIRMYAIIPRQTDARMKSLEMLDFSRAFLISPCLHADLALIKKVFSEW